MPRLDLDALSGLRFELVVATLYLAQRYTVALTAATRDQGVDILATTDSDRKAVQAKRWSGAVPNGAVQEVIAGRLFYRCSSAVVVTSSHFSKDAIRLARAADVELIDRTELVEQLHACGLYRVGA